MEAQNGPARSPPADPEQALVLALAQAVVDSRAAGQDHAAQVAWRALGYLAVKQRKRSLVLLFTDVSGGVSVQALTSYVSVLARHSLPLVVTISDPAVHAVAAAHPADSAAVYQRALAEKLLEERRVTLDTLERRGVLTLDVPAEKLTMAVINKYLELKAKTLL